MGYVRFLLSIASLAGLSACGGHHHLTAGTDANGSSPAGGHSVAGSVISRQTSLTSADASGGRLIALTFDDGPRPYVLFGSKGIHPAPGLVDILDQNGVKATFFVVGWRLTPKTWGEPRHEEDIGVTCLDAAEQLIKRGHELEDHTYSHLELRSAEKKNGEQWVMHDVDRGAQAIKAVTGVQPRYVRPPDWIITSDARRDLEQQGFRVLTISAENPMALRELARLSVCRQGSWVSEAVFGGRNVTTGGAAREKRNVHTHSGVP
jgi:peptidoglycan/xylan/chitin deacetylase (PgdA/CDA1 family)